jgi:GNAT acetyltransferase-like protein
MRLAILRGRSMTTKPRPAIDVALVERAPAGYPVGGWVEQQIHIKFVIGRVLLRTVSLQGAELGFHPFDLPAHPSPVWPPRGTTRSDVHVALIRSHRIQVPLPRLSFLPERIRYVPRQYDYFFIDLRGAFADYLSRLSGQARHNLRRVLRRFAELSGGTIAFQEFREPERMTEFHRLAMAVSRKTYQRRLLEDGLPADPEFGRQLTEKARCGAVRGFILSLRDSPAAFGLCVAEGDILVYQRTGYDPDLRRHSPGNVLFYLMLERIYAERRFRLLDMGGGDHPYKSVFATNSMRCADIYYFQPTARHLLLLCAHTGWAVTTRAVAVALERFALRGTVRRALRGWLLRTPT